MPVMGISLVGGIFAEAECCTVQVLQPWDDSKFNFTKALQKEVLFQVEASDMPSKGSSFVPLAPVTGETSVNTSSTCSEIDNFSSCSDVEPSPEVKIGALT